jgi:hypothetical protein
MSETSPTLSAVRRKAVGTLRPLVRGQCAANDARAFGPGWEQHGALLAELIEHSGNRTASWTDAHPAVPYCGARFCACRHDPNSTCAKYPFERVAVVDADQIPYFQAGSGGSGKSLAPAMRRCRCDPAEGFVGAGPGFAGSGRMSDLDLNQQTPLPWSA